MIIRRRIMSENKEKIIIMKESPVTITQEFIIFLEYIKSNQVKLTKTREYITRKHLMQIYSLIGKDKHDVSPKGDQIDYPVIHLFFHLGLELDLIRKIGTKGNIFLEIEPNRFSPYKKLTESEQYITLLEMFWINLD